MSALKAMFSFFTVIRIDITQKDMDDMDRRFYLVPIVGAFYGILAVALMLALSEAIPMLAAAVLTMFVIQVMNRFLHFDGTVDTGDGLAVAGKREDHLRALKDTRIGAGGMAFALFVTMLTVAALSGITAGYLILVPLTAEILAKNSMVSAAAFGTPGDGMAGNSVRNTTVKSLFISSLLSIAMILFFTIAVKEAGWFHFDYENIKFWAMMLSVFVVSVITGAVMSAISKKNFGIVNGDILGATNEISRMITLLMMLALIPVI
jgi:adenosylcobinamide-GDP ribazoletransferase